MAPKRGNPTDHESFLTWEALVDVLSYDPATGEFRWVKSGRLGWVGRLAGSIDAANGYRRIEILGRGFNASRLAWLYMTKRWPRGLVDHKNGVREDDRWSNLRDVSRRENRHNWHTAEVISLNRETAPQPAKISPIAPEKKVPRRGKANDIESFLSHGMLIEILVYDPAAGVFHWRSNKTNPRRIKVGTRACTVSDGSGYADVWVLGRKFRAHRLAFLYMTGRWPKADVDHINGAKADNRWVNLREASRAQNVYNRGKNKNNTSGAKGVYLRPNGRYQAYIGVGAKTIKLGTFSTVEEAMSARQQYESANIGEFARKGK